MSPAAPPRPTRRALLVGGGAAAGLVLAWTLWPRDYRPNLRAGAGETVLDAFLKVGADGRVTVVVPQGEFGQGIWTALPQALADELGADWRQVGVEPAPVNPLYANRLLAGEWAADAGPAWARDVAGWAATEWATRHATMLTVGSTSVRAFEGAFRAAGATARALLCMAAGKRLGADWRACDTAAGFVVRGDDRFRFGELAAEAAGFAPPAVPPLRRAGAGGIAGQPLARLDAPAKVDGSWRHAGDVRLPGLVHAAIRHAPPGGRLLGADLLAADRVAGALGVVRSDGWIAALGQTGWAAERALDAAAPRFAGAAPAPAEPALAAALAAGGTRLVARGAPDRLLAGPGLVVAEFAAAARPYATLEPFAATARVNGDRLELWLASQAPGLHRDQVAAATGWSPDAVVLFPMPGGGGCNARLQGAVGAEAAVLAGQARRPVALAWSRAEELRVAATQAPARARLVARPAANGRLAAWGATVAAPPVAGRLARQLAPGLTGRPGAEAAALDGAVPPYAVGALALAHAPVDLGPHGLPWAGAHAFNAFAAECFADELAAVAGLDPLAFRMGLLGDAPRLARCLAQVAAAGGWTGEAGSGQGLACHSAFGAHVAVLAQVAMDGGRPRVARLAAVADCGRVLNPDIVRQQVEAGLVWGQALALGAAAAPDLAGLRLPRLADVGAVEVQLVPSAAAPGGAAELGVPAAAPAIANALWTLTGRRVRTLPFG